ncbi:MAG: hypothetical protein J2P17_26640 [Mycobacterium sp.]|nr:hypothetical protein [Mycobacterium sp.]
MIYKETFAPGIKHNGITPDALTPADKGRPKMRHCSLHAASRRMPFVEAGHNALTNPERPGHPWRASCKSKDCTNGALRDVRLFRQAGGYDLDDSSVFYITLV